VRIAFLIRSLNVGGAERQLTVLALGLSRKGHQVRLFTYYPGGELEKDLPGEKVEVVSLYKKGRWDFPSFLLRTIKELREFRPDVLHSYLGTSNILAGMLRIFYPFSKVVYGIRYSQINFADYDWTIPLVYKLEALLTRLADLVIVNSNAGRDSQIRLGADAGRIKVIPNGVDLVTFRPDRSLGKAIRQGWRLEEKEILIGIIGRLDPVKDHLTFLGAAASSASRDDRLRFVVVGSGPSEYRQKLVNSPEVQVLGARLIWAGERNDMPAVYNALDICCSSSIGEGFSNVLSEAMACGVPCVASDVGDSALILGETGVAFPAGDIDGLARIFLDFAAMSRESLAERGVQACRRIVEKFSQDVMIERTEQALLSLLPKAGSRDRKSVGSGS